jgi:hypothetical protein
LFRLHPRREGRTRDRRQGACRTVDSEPDDFIGWRIGGIKKVSRGVHSQAVHRGGPKTRRGIGQQKGRSAHSRQRARLTYRGGVNPPDVIIDRIQKCVGRICRNAEPSGRQWTAGLFGQHSCGGVDAEHKDRAVAGGIEKAGAGGGGLVSPLGLPLPHPKVSAVERMQIPARAQTEPNCIHCLR